MANTIREVIKEPHPDVELGLERGELEYFVTLPENGVNKETGVILSIPGFADTANSDYQINKLMPYLADKYDCVVVGVNYFGINRSGYIKKFDFLKSFCKNYNVHEGQFFDSEGLPRFKSFDEAAYQMCTILRERRVNKLDKDCRPIITQVKDYESFGFLPAVDNLTVLATVLSNYNVDHRKLVAYGSSYGGFIAWLMGKYAPHTFSVIVDNSGYSQAIISEVAAHELLPVEGNPIMSIEIGNVNYNLNGVRMQPWTVMSEEYPGYFSDSCRRIRSLLENAHRVPSKTRYYVFHSPEDLIAPIAEKDGAIGILSQYNQVYYKRMEPRDIDGQVFKNMKHAMDASLRGLFDIVAALDDTKFAKQEDYTDFSLNSVNAFDCGKKTYSFKFKADYNFEVTITDTANQSRINRVI
ncbi:MAG: DUF2920 family protein [Acidobacteriota bacterium]